MPRSSAPCCAASIYAWYWNEGASDDEYRADPDDVPGEPSVAEIVPSRAFGLRVMMLMTPFIAFAPHRLPPGPRITSMRSISETGTVSASQKTPENSRE